MSGSLRVGRSTGDGAPVELNAADLTTHAVCVGMTGSGKTGLCLVLLEELGRAGVPVVALDTKGDLTNLALLFPELRPADFEPWLLPREVPDEVAVRWRDGLASAGLSAADVAALRDGSPRRLFTPGSDVGGSINILSGLNPPALDWGAHAAELRQRIGTTVTALLGLVGIAADPLTSPEHLVLAHLLETLWQSGRPVTLEAIIGGVQSPPFTKVGVFEVDTVLPAKERLKLALLLNQLLASPTFQAWQTGAPLGPELFLPGPDGRAPTCILYLAHLQEPERHFFVTLFLEMVNSWMRQQAGTRDLRLLIFLDEVVGYLPPHPYNPPTKAPLLTLFKQARAFGVGMALATQNPVDMDYKALTNAGTWMVGRLQTEQDRDRLGETLEAAVQGSGRADVAATIAGLGKRQFLITSPGLDAPAISETRWAMSFLAGPLTLPQIRQLRELGLIADLGAPTPAEPEPVPATVAPPPATAEPAQPPRAQPATVAEYQAVGADAATEVVGQVLCRATVRYVTQKPPVDHTETLLIRCEWPPPPDSAPRVFLLSPDDVRAGRPAGAAPPGWDARSLKAAAQLVADRLYAKRRLNLFENGKLGLQSNLGESRESFDARCRGALAERFEQLRAKLDDTYQERLSKLQERLREEERQLRQAEAQANQRSREGMLDVGSQVFDMLVGGGRRTRRVTQMVRGAARTAGRRRSAQDDVDDQREDVQAVEAQIGALAESREEDEAELAAKLQALLAESSNLEIAPRRQDIAIVETAVVWVPR